MNITHANFIDKHLYEQAVVKKHDSTMLNLIEQ